MTRFFKTLAAVLVLCILYGCSTNAPVVVQRDGGPTQDVDVSHVPDATPAPVVRTIAGNKSPYTVLGKTYRLLPDSKGYQQRGEASWYGTKFHGRRTANGEVYDMFAMTAAHKTLPIPSYVRVTNVNNGLSVVVRINDRGPFHGDRIIDLSYAAAKKLGFAGQGFTVVDLQDVTPAPGDHRVIAPAKPELNSPVVAEPAVPTVVSPSTATSAVATAETAPLKPVLPTAIAPTAADTKTIVAQSSNGTVTSIERKPVVGYLQVGAFKDLAAALSLKKQLSTDIDQSADIYLADNGWYRVRLGPFGSEQALANTRFRLGQKGFNNSYVVYE